MAYHILANGAAAVSPNYLYGPNGTVAHPLQRSGHIPHLSNGTGSASGSLAPQGHPFFGAVKGVVHTIGAAK